MKVGVVIPSGVPGIDATTLTEWCRRIDEGPFSSLAVPDRLVYPNLEPMQVLAFAAGATSRVRIVSSAVIPALRGRALFAKQAATLSVLAQGRLTLGVVAGARPNDYEAAEVDWSRRCPMLTEHLEYLQRLREPEDGQALGPPLGEVEILIGGARRYGLEWLVRFGNGYISGGIKPQFFGYEAQATRGAWQEAGKAGEPRIVAGTWLASEKRYDATVRNLEHYLAQGGPPEPIRDQVWRGEEGFRQALDEFGAHGMDEIIFFPHVSDVAEVEWLAGLAAEVAEPAGVA